MAEGVFVRSDEQVWEWNKSGYRWGYSALSILFLKKHEIVFFFFWVIVYENIKGMFITLIALLGVLFAGFKIEIKGVHL